MKKLLSLLLLSFTLLAACERDTTYDDFAQCLADSDAKFYGAFWCPHCADQKKLFGDSIDYVPYVECDPNGKNSQAELCQDEGVQSYPTWIFADGTTQSGVLSLEEISELSSCPLPGEESVMELPAEEE